MYDYPPEYDNEQLDNSIVEEAFGSYESLGEMYRSIYKYTSCGPSIGVCISYFKTVEPDGFNDYLCDQEVSEWIYCSGLYKLGTWKDMQDNGYLITAISVSSIVEGVDYDTDTIEIECHPDKLEAELIPADGDDLAKTLSRLFDAALVEIERQAEAIWHDTHGCETCIAHWNGESHAIWTDCPDCDGEGTVI